VVRAVGPDGRVRSSRSSPLRNAWAVPHAIRAIGDQIVVAGDYFAAAPLVGHLPALPTSPARSGFLLRLGDRPTAATWSMAHGSFGMAITRTGDAIVLRTSTYDGPATLERLTVTGTRLWEHAVSRGKLDVHEPKRALFANPNGDRFAWLQQDRPAFGGHHQTIHVVDETGRYLHAWSIPVAAGTFAAPLQGLDREDRAVLGGYLAGPLTLGHVRLVQRSYVKLVAWLDPRRRPNVPQ
jgi:hypothetical protein